MTTAAKVETVPPPRCPHCKAEMFSIRCYSWVMAPYLILATYCPNLDCRVLIQCVLQTLPQPEEDPAGEGAGIPGKRIVSPS